MWTVVHFTNENSVEAVPSHWVKKDVCGWPKKNVKKHLHHRTLLNKYDFDYFPSRILKKGIASYLEAKSKMKKAEETSDLSTCDEIQTKIRGKKVVIQDPPIFNELFNKDDLLKSVDNYEALNNCQRNSQVPIKRSLFDVTPSRSRQDDLSKSADDYEALKNCQRSSQIPTKRRLFDATTSRQDFSDDFCDLKNSQNDIPNSPDIFNFSTNLNDSCNTYGTIIEKSTVVHTTASPFKVTQLDSNQYKIIENQPKNSRMLVSGTSSFHGTIADKSKPTIKATESNSDETLKKILSVVMKIKYDVENISHNQARMDNILTETIMNMGSISSSSHENTNSNDDDNDYCLLLPLHNEDELNNFEDKLLNKSFRLNAVNGLKRLAKKSLTSTVRQMMRTIFDDEFLQIFSYVGQKKKKIFSSLASCAIIFEAIRKIRNFQDVTNADIEMPIKIYLAGAAFRKKK